MVQRDPGSWIFGSRHGRTGLKFGSNALAAALALVILITCFWFWRSLRSAPVAPEPLLVQTMTVKPRIVPDIIETSGTILSPQTVEIRPRTDGVVESVHVTDGQTVEKGQLLFTIDPRPLRAALAQAIATTERDRALLADASDTADRYDMLLRQGAISQKAAVTARDAAKSLDSTVALDQAQVRQARLSLAYTEIRAPLSGRAGAIQIKPGNLVTAGSTTALITLNVDAAVQASFALPHVQVEQVRRAGGNGLTVLVLDPNTAKQLGRGSLYFLDNAFDDSSGTLAMRARLLNPGQIFSPGQFVTIRVILSERPDTIAVPETALQQGQQGPYVYCVVDGHAVLRQLTVARLVDGQAVVTKGVQAGDKVILTVPNELRDGSLVQSGNMAGGIKAHA